MGRSCFLKFLLLAALLALSISRGHGFGRKMMETVEYGEPMVQAEETVGLSRETSEVMDYEEPKPNINPKTGYMFPPPPQPT